MRGTSCFVWGREGGDGTCRGRTDHWRRLVVAGRDLRGLSWGRLGLTLVDALERGRVVLGRIAYIAAGIVPAGDAGLR